MSTIRARFGGFFDSAHRADVFLIAVEFAIIIGIFTTYRPGAAGARPNSTPAFLAAILPGSDIVLALGLLVAITYCLVQRLAYGRVLVRREFLAASAPLFIYVMATLVLVVATPGSNVGTGLVYALTWMLLVEMKQRGAT